MLTDSISYCTKNRPHIHFLINTMYKEVSNAVVLWTLECPDPDLIAGNKERR